MANNVGVNWRGGGGEGVVRGVVEGVEKGMGRRKEVVKGAGGAGGKLFQNIQGVLEFESFRCPFGEGEGGGGGGKGKEGEKKVTKGEMLENVHLSLVKRFGLLHKKLRQGMEGLGREGRGVLVAVEKWREAKKGYQEVMKEWRRGGGGGGGGVGGEKERERERLRQKLGQVGVEGWGGMGRLRGCLERAMGSLWGGWRGLKKVRGRENLCHVSHVCVYLYFSVVEGGGRRILELLFSGGEGGEEGEVGEGVVEVVEECLRLCREVVRGATELFQCLFVLFRYVSGMFDPSSLAFSPSSSPSRLIPPIVVPSKVPSLPNPIQTQGFLPPDSPLLPPAPRLFPLVLTPDMKFPPPSSFIIPPLSLQRTPQQTFLSLLSDPSSCCPPPSPSPFPSSFANTPFYFPSNEKAFLALQTVENKMEGIEKKKKRSEEEEGGGSGNNEELEQMTVTEQFDFLVAESMSENNLSKLYEGWLAWI